MQVYELSKKTGIPAKQLMEDLGKKSPMSKVSEEESAKYVVAEQVKEEPVAESVEKPQTEQKVSKPESKQPGYLVRRAAQIEREKQALSMGTDKAAIQYGENAPEFLKRRFGGK